MSKQEFEVTDTNRTWDLINKLCQSLKKRKDSFVDYSVFFKMFYNFKWNRRFFRISSLWLLNSPVTLPISLGDHKMNSLLGCPVNTKVISGFRIRRAFGLFALLAARYIFLATRVSFSFSTVNVAGVWLEPFELYCPTMCHWYRENQQLNIYFGRHCMFLNKRLSRERKALR